MNISTNYMFCVCSKLKKSLILEKVYLNSTCKLYKFFYNHFNSILAKKGQPYEISSYKECLMIALNPKT